MIPSALWRFLALAGALVALVFVALDAADTRALSSDHVVWKMVGGPSDGTLVVVSVNGTPAETGDLRPGDVIAPLAPNRLRMRESAEPPGTVETWSVQRGSARFQTTTRVGAIDTDDLIILEVFNAVRLAMILVAIPVALRRPDVPAARSLVTFLVTMGVTLVPAGAWLPDPAFGVWRIVRGPLQIWSLSQGLNYACVFPFASAGGVRRWLQRANPWYTAVAVAATLALGLSALRNGGVSSAPAIENVIGWSPLLYFPSILIAFGVAAVKATGRDRQRVLWAAGSICIGFSGPLVATLTLAFANPEGHWLDFLALTLIAMPLGLAYTILRHRTVDIGFVISRALVLTVLSAAIVLAFGVVERLLGKIFIDASHIASSSVEIALALGLGFSLRTLHARIETVIDRLFFRHRQRSLAALAAYGSDVYFITDPDVVLERTVDIAYRCADAENAALYLIAGRVFGRAAAINPAALPPEIDENDPLFVRMRAARRAEMPREVASGLDAEIAFPMFVRATLVGALVLAAKRSGEAYDPEECALLADLAGRVGLALDALQTAAIRSELEALMPATGGAAAAL